MNPDEFDKFKAALAAAGESILSVLDGLESVAPPFSLDSHTATGSLSHPPTACSGGHGNLIIIGTGGTGGKVIKGITEALSAVHKDLAGPPPGPLCPIPNIGSQAHPVSFLDSLTQAFLDAMPKPACTILYEDKTPSLLDALLNGSQEERAMDDFLQHSVISSLHNSDFTGLAKFTAAVPGAEHIGFETPARHDAGIYAPSILAYNGRSLDPHDPWHLNGLALEELDAPDLASTAGWISQTSPSFFGHDTWITPTCASPSAQESSFFLRPSTYVHGIPACVLDAIFHTPEDRIVNSAEENLHDEFKDRTGRHGERHRAPGVLALDTWWK